MSNDPKPGVIGSLPRTRPHRRSDKRPAPASGAPPLDTQAQEAAVVKAAAPPKARSARPSTARATKPVVAKAKPAAAKAKPAAAKAKPAAGAAATAKPAAAKAKPKPAGAARRKPPAARPTPTPPAATPPPPEPSPGPLGTAVQAAAELAEIGLHAGARALRRAVSRLPRS